MIRRDGTAGLHWGVSTGSRCAAEPRSDGGDRPLARGETRDVHRTGTAVAKAASRLVAGCANNARTNVHIATDAVPDAVGRKPAALAAVGFGACIFGMAAAAQVFVVQALLQTT